MLQIDNLSVKYSDKEPILKHLNFQIAEGETVGIIGTNGAGKSTFLMSAVGILSPYEGRIVVDGLEVNKKNLRSIRERIGVVFQNPDDQLFMSSVYDDIAFGLRNSGMEEDVIKEKINHIIKDLNIEKLMTHSSGKLSGGEKRIIAIATVLIMEPSLILFDEPTSFLDPKTRRKLIELLKTLDMIKIIATHDLDMALELCSRVIILKDGTVFADGKAKDILLNEELLDEAGLELPFCLQKVQI